MGNRVVVMLRTDQCAEWQNDIDLGKKIAHAMNYAAGAPGNPEARLDGYGAVVQCAHADRQTLAIIDSFQFHPLLGSTWRSGEDLATRDIRLLKEAAGALGYRLVRKN